MADILSQEEIEALLDVCEDNVLSTKFQHSIEILMNATVQGTVVESTALINTKNILYIKETLGLARKENSELIKRVSFLEQLIQEIKKESSN